jgi:hypothetical protein
MLSRRHPTRLSGVTPLAWRTRPWSSSRRRPELAQILIETHGPAALIVLIAPAHGPAFRCTCFLLVLYVSFSEVLEPPSCSCSYVLIAPAWFAALIVSSGGPHRSCTQMGRDRRRGQWEWFDFYGCAQRARFRGLFVKFHRRKLLNLQGPE